MIKLIAFLIPFLISNNSFAGAEQESQKAINQVGEPCHKVTQVFFNTQESDGTFQVSVACSGGENYFLRIKRNGDAQVMKCAIADRIAGGRGKKGSCFTKY